MSDLTRREVLLTVGVNQGDLYKRNIYNAALNESMPSATAHHFTSAALTCVIRHKQAGGGDYTAQDILNLASDLLDYYAEYVKEK